MKTLFPVFVSGALFFIALGSVMYLLLRAKWSFMTPDEKASVIYFILGCGMLFFICVLGVIMTF